MLAAGAVLVAAPAAAHAAAPLVVGIGDQKPSMFEDPRFQQLGLRHTRYLAPWDGVYRDPHRIERWMTAARNAGSVPLVAFGASDRDACPRRPCRLPSIGAFRRAFARFRELYPEVKTFQPWNEANHQSQPTARNPKRAAQYYNAMRQMCRTCTIVAADLLDSPNMVPWAREFMKTARRPRIWGLHNYSDTNRFTDERTQRLLRAVRGQVWLTETGGIVRFETSDGRVVFRKSARRAANATRYLFRLAQKHRSRIRRLYLYHWQSDPGFRFDAGLVDANGRPRPAFWVVRNAIEQLRVPRSPLPRRRR